MLKTLGPTLRQVLLIEGRRARVRRHSVPLGQLDQAHPRADSLAADASLPHDATDGLPISMQGLYRFEQRLFRDTSLVYDALTVPCYFRCGSTAFQDPVVVLMGLGRDRKERWRASSCSTAVLRLRDK